MCNLRIYRPAPSPHARQSEADHLPVIEATPKCLRCRATTFAHVVDRASGENGPLALTLNGLRIHVCGRGHRQLSHGTFAARYLLSAINAGEGGLPPALARGFWPRRGNCSGCGAPMGTGESYSRVFCLKVQDPEAPLAGVELALPVYRCVGCGKEHLRSRKDLQFLSGALLGALRAAGVAAEVDELVGAE